MEKNFSLEKIGYFLNEAWKRKKQLTTGISTNHLDVIYKKILESGALGAKLSGAGKGGFFLTVVPQHDMHDFIRLMSPLIVTPIQISSAGSQII